MTDTASSNVSHAVWQERAWLGSAVLGAVLASVVAIVSTLAIIEFIRAPSTTPVWIATGALIVAGALHSIASFIAHTSEAKVATTLRLGLAEHVAALPIPQLNHLSVVGLRARLDSDVTALHHLVAHAPADIATMLVAPIATIAAMVAYAGPLALVITIPALLSLALQLLVIPRQSRAAAGERQQALGQIAYAVDDLSRGIAVTKVYGNAAGAAARYTESTNRFARDFRRWVSRVSAPAAIASGILQPVVTLALAYSIGHSLPVHILAALLLFGVALSVPVLRFGHGMDYVRDGITAARRIDELLRAPTLRPGPTDLAAMTAELPPVAHALHVREIVVELNGRRVLDDLSLEIPANMLTAITGPSGSGKTTLLRVLGRGIDPTTGAIAIDGYDYGAIPLFRMPELVVTVPQNPSVLPQSVRENLLLAAPDADDVRLLRALRTAALTIDLSANAEVLSGGQRQRLALARALLTDAPVLLLDEPTSALDAETADAVLNSLVRVNNRTIVMVTHNQKLAARAPHRIHLIEGKVHS